VGSLVYTDNRSKMVVALSHPGLLVPVIQTVYYKAKSVIPAWTVGG